MREKDKYILYFVPSAHDPSNPIVLVSFGPQIILAQHEKYPHKPGPAWTSREHWTLQSPYEFATHHTWMKNWLGDLVRNSTNSEEVSSVEPSYLESC